MNNEFESASWFALEESSHLRAEAFAIFDRCLAEDNPAPIVAFIQAQLIDEPPQLLVLSELADELHNKLTTLRSAHLDVRSRVIRVLAQDYKIDLSALLTATQLAHFHELDPQWLLAHIQAQRGSSPKETKAMRRLLTASMQAGARLHRQIAVAAALYDMVRDWYTALSAAVSRQYWSEPEQGIAPGYIQ
jgi:hypothetical protein